jgi:23S rRNA pseudouridine1911/1915/1917 synthase
MIDRESELFPLPDEEEGEGGLFEHFSLVVDKGQAMLRIDKFLSDKMANVSRTRIQYAAEAGNLIVNDKTVKPNYRVKPGDRISVVFPHPPKDTRIYPEDIPLNVVFEDDDILVINKPNGLVVHPGAGNWTGTLVNALVHRYQDLPLYAGDEPRPGLVHRIDKETTGLLLIAKTESALNKLAKQFFEKTVERTYWALVWGDLKEDSGTIRANIGRKPGLRKTQAVFPEGEGGKPAVTHYRVLERFHYVTLVECRLETGRTHQIRVHFKHIGHPLFGDMDYGGDQVLKGTLFSKYKTFVENLFAVLPRQALHAKTLGFIHPANGKKISFDSELPDDMQQVIVKWRRYLLSRSEKLD